LKQFTLGVKVRSIAVKSIETKKLQASKISAAYTGPRLKEKLGALNGTIKMHRKNFPQYGHRVISLKIIYYQTSQLESFVPISLTLNIGYFVKTEQ